MSLEDLKQELLLKLTDLVKLNIDHAPKVCYGDVHFSGDARDETVLEKIIRTKKSEINQRVKITSANSFDLVEEIIETSIAESDNLVYHPGYLHYLLHAWKNYLGIEVGPWHIWNIIVWNLKEINKCNPEKFRKLWTESTEKINIEIPNNEFDIDLPNNEFDIDLVFAKLRKFIPNNTLDALLLQFDSKIEPYYLDSIKGLLGDVIEDYYSVMIYSCKITDVVVVGTIGDFKKMHQQLQLVKNLYQSFSDVDTDRYLEKVDNYLLLCIENFNNKKWWMEFFNIVNCGSGSQKSIDGHIKNLFCHDEILLEKLPKITSRFGFKVDNVSHRYISGVMYSELDDDNILRPKFGYWLTKITAESCADDVVTKQNNLLAAMKIFNSYSRPPVYCSGISEYEFEKSIECHDIILGKISMDQHIKNLQIRIANLDIEKTKNIVFDLQRKFIGKDDIDILNDIINNKNKLLSRTFNFWFKDYKKNYSQNSISLTTEQWLLGRKRQENIQLVCEYLPKIVKSLLENDTTMHNEYEILLNKYIMPCYHEDIYTAFAKTAPTIWDTTESDVLTHIVRYLLSNTWKKDHICKHISQGSTHTVSIAKILIGKILGDTDEEIIKKLVDLLAADLYQNMTNNYKGIYFQNKHQANRGSNRIISLVVNEQSLMDDLFVPITILGNVLRINIDTIKFANEYVLKKYGYTIRFRTLQRVYFPVGKSVPIDEFLANTETEELQKNDFMLCINDQYVPASPSLKKFVLSLVKFDFGKEIELLTDNELHLHRDMNFDQWQVFTSKQNKVFNDYLDNFDETYEFIKLNDPDGCIFQDKIFSSLNPTIYKRFLDQYQKNPYQIVWKFGEFDHNYYNIYVNTTINDLSSMIPLFLLKLLTNKEKSIEKEIREEIVSDLINHYADANIYPAICQTLIEKFPVLIKAIEKPWKYEDRPKHYFNDVLYQERATKLNSDALYPVITIIRSISECCEIPIEFDDAYVNRIIDDVIPQDKRLKRKPVPEFKFPVV